MLKIRKFTCYPYSDIIVLVFTMHSLSTAKINAHKIVQAGHSKYILQLLQHWWQYTTQVSVQKPSWFGLHSYLHYTLHYE